jgi:diguanylate cyclase (GGDEF)-like protein
MDAKANTHLCDSPTPQADLDSLPSPADAANLIVVRGALPGTMLRIVEGGTALGRSADNTFQLDDITVSRRHAFVWMDSLGAFHLRDEGSTNGTYLNGRRLESYRGERLEDGDRIQLGTAIVLKLVRLDPSDERFQREMFERTVRDALTGLYNRTYFLNQLGALVARHSIQGLGLAVLMLDVDHFKRINDLHGHLVGDVILREVAAVIRESTRAEDLVARYGGEEFVIALPVFAPDLATERAERIRSNLAERRILAGNQEMNVTVSIGLAFGPPGRPRHELALLEVADSALYQAKADGRNRVVFGSHVRTGESPETESDDIVTSFRP